MPARRALDQRNSQRLHAIAYISVKSLSARIKSDKGTSIKTDEIWTRSRPRSTSRTAASTAGSFALSVFTAFIRVQCSGPLSQIAQTFGCRLQGFVVLGETEPHQLCVGCGLVECRHRDRGHARFAHHPLAEIQIVRVADR